MREIRQNDYMKIFKLNAVNAEKLDQMVNKKEYIYEQKLVERVAQATEKLTMAKSTQD